MNELILAIVLQVPNGMAAADFFDLHCPDWRNPPTSTPARMELYIKPNGEGVFIPANAPIWPMKCKYPDNIATVTYKLPVMREDGTLLTPDELSRGKVSICSTGLYELDGLLSKKSAEVCQ